MSNEDDSINQSIVAVESEETIDEIKSSESSIPDTIRELRKTIYQENPLKMANVSAENKKGMTEIVILNEFMEKNYGFRFDSLDNIVSECMQRNMSINAFGIAAFDSALKSIQMSFQSQTAEASDKLLKNILHR